MINSFKQYLVEEEKTVYFTFGRMNPPTTGHEKLMNELAKKAGRNPYKVYLSQSNDKKKNPLMYQEKVKMVRKFFPKHARQVILDKKVKNVFDVATKLFNEGYKNLTMVVGSDRVNEFNTLLNKYNGVKGRHGFYQFENGVKVVSAGERDPDAEGAIGMSASKLRAAASENNLKLFAKGMPKGFKEIESLFNAVRAGMGLKESKDFRKHVQLEKVSDRREDYVNGKLFRTGDDVIVKESQEVGKITVLGANYVMVDFGNSKKRCWQIGRAHV